MLDQQTKVINPSLVNRSQSYSEYREMIDKLLNLNQTTGSIQTEGYLEYTRMNVKRMNRWDKTAKIATEMENIIKSVREPLVFLIITEAWCGDAAQSIPYISKLAALNPNIQLKLVLRDENPDLMDAYLTEGARSIPKLIVLSSDLEREFATWGPRPKYLQDRLKAYKLDPKSVSPKLFSEGTHLWYAKDKNQSLERELLDLFKSKLDL